MSLQTQRETYRIVSAHGMQDLAEKVNELLSQGWSLQGGVSVVSFGQLAGGREFYQAMTKTDVR